MNINRNIMEDHEIMLHNIKLHKYTICTKYSEMISSRQLTE